MPTIREITSEIQTDINARNIDEYVSKRYIYNKLRDKAKTLIRQENTLKLYKQMSLFTTVPCIEMITVPLVDCCSVFIPSHETLQRSKFKLPRLYETTYGKYLITIRDLLNTRTFVPTTPQEYQSLIQLEYQDPNIRYFWIENDYLIIPDSTVEVVIISGLFPEPDEAKKLNSCLKADDSSNCSSILDNTFVCPDYLVSIVKAQTTQEILNSFKRIQPDQKPNEDSNDRQ